MADKPFSFHEIMQETFPWLRLSNKARKPRFDLVPGLAMGISIAKKSTYINLDQDGYGWHDHFSNSDPNEALGVAWEAIDAIRSAPLALEPLFLFATLHFTMSFGGSAMDSDCDPYISLDKGALIVLNPLHMSHGFGVVEERVHPSKWRWYNQQSFSYVKHTGSKALIDFLPPKGGR